jgi:DNA-binding GntR family transcriptional regulator
MPITISKKEKAYQTIKKAIIIGQLEPAKIYNINELSETFEVGRKVEAVGLAAERITDKGIYLLEENSHQEEETALSLQSDVSAQSYRKGYDLNLEFHLTIAQVSGNNRLAGLVEKLLNELVRVLAHDPQIAEPQQHAEILEGLKRRDKLGAQEAMRKHLEDTKSHTLSRF